MADNSTLTAYLVPRLTKQVENAATDALSYILNRSNGSMQALNDLLREGGFDVASIANVKTQVTYKDGSRPDMAGYDTNNVKRLLVEAKFWASLLEDQASGYARQFEHPGPATLLFISPELRIPTLWAEIERQMEEQSSLELIDSAPGVRRARVIWAELSDTELQLLLVSWIRLLDRMDARTDEDGVRSDIRQLRGLAERLDAEAFLPVHSEDLSPDFGRRVVGYNQLVDDVVGARGVPGGWMDINGMQATSRRYGYGRYFRFFGMSESSWLWFGVNHELWARSGDTPLWLRVGDGIDANVYEIGRALNVQVQERWFPIHPRLGVEYPEVLNDVVSKLMVIAKILGVHLPPE